MRDCFQDCSAEVSCLGVGEAYCVFCWLGMKGIGELQGTGEVLSDYTVAYIVKEEKRIKKKKKLQGIGVPLILKSEVKP